MALDPSVERLLGRLAALGRAGAPSTIAERRTALEELLSFSGPPQSVGEMEESVVPGPSGELRARIYTPARVESALLPGLIYFHGGGFVAGSLDSHDAICRALSNASGCRLISVDYRLAPEHRFPAAVADGYAALCGIAKRPEEFGLAADRLLVAGDSAGATIAAVICQMAGASREARPAGQVLLCPILDYGADTPSRRAFGQGYLLDEAILQQDLAHYLGPGVSCADIRVSPLRAPSVADLPPTCIHTAEYDPMRDEGAAYAERLRSAGIETHYRCHPGMIHLFYGLGALIPYTAHAFEFLGADIRAMLEASRRPEKP